MQQVYFSWCTKCSLFHELYSVGAFHHKDFTSFKVGPDEVTTQATPAKVYSLVIIPILPRDIAGNSNLF